MLCEVKDQKLWQKLQNQYIFNFNYNYIPNTPVGLSQEDCDKAVSVVEDPSNHEIVLETYSDNFYLDST